MIKLIDILNEIKVVPGGARSIKGLYILKIMWHHGRECEVNIEAFNSEKEAKDAALSYIWEVMWDNEDTELTKEEFLNTYSFDNYINGDIGYEDVGYEIEKLK